MSSHLQFRELESLGYRALAFGFFEQDVQTAYTTECSCAITPSVIDYIRSVIVAGMYLYMLVCVVPKIYL